jgi:hypothetical protein
MALRHPPDVLPFDALRLDEYFRVLHHVVDQRPGWGSTNSVVKRHEGANIAG